jgi:hypothetical protein
MSPESLSSGPSISGFQAMVLLWAWGLAVLVHGGWRSLRPATDRLRPSGPVE